MLASCPSVHNEYKRSDRRRRRQLDVAEDLVTPQLRQGATNPQTPCSASGLRDFRWNRTISAKTARGRSSEHPLTVHVQYVTPVVEDNLPISKPPLPGHLSNEVAVYLCLMKQGSSKGYGVEYRMGNDSSERSASQDVGRSMLTANGTGLALINYMSPKPSVAIDAACCTH